MHYELQHACLRDKNGAREIDQREWEGEGEVTCHRAK